MTGLPTAAEADARVSGDVDEAVVLRTILEPIAFSAAAEGGIDGRTHARLRELLVRMRATGADEAAFWHAEGAFVTALATAAAGPELSRALGAAVVAGDWPRHVDRLVWTEVLDELLDAVDGADVTRARLLGTRLSRNRLRTPVAVD